MKWFIKVRRVGDTFELNYNLPTRLDGRVVFPIEEECGLGTIEMMEVRQSLQHLTGLFTSNTMNDLLVMDINFDYE